MRLSCVTESLDCTDYDNVNIFSLVLALIIRVRYSTYKKTVKKRCSSIRQTRVHIEVRSSVELGAKNRMTLTTAHRLGRNSLSKNRNSKYQIYTYILFKRDTFNLEA